MMAGALQRSAQTFRRSGSSGLVWDKRFLTEGAENGGPELRHSRSVGALWRGGCRHGTAGLEHDDKKRKMLVELARPKPKHHHKQRQQPAGEEGTGRKAAFRTRDVAPAAEPPSPRVPSCCAPCAILRGSGAGGSSSARRARKR